jgi:hypothetical protein
MYVWPENPVKKQRTTSLNTTVFDRENKKRR